MNGNEIIAEIHQRREELSRACGYDVKKLMDYYRRREKENDAAGHELVSYVQPASTDKASCALREEPPKK
ncbi:MAG TPA: hypothetical protein VNN22_08630 [Verrucomicrobiae bacterium]|nr:hypothetical protein [Verrucomicrobiae bacterium]